jgi:lipopolysaccharide/colanic/teichoic acid biosynthesis glycosyltransferase
VLLVRLTSRGPGIYQQARVGKNGRKFMMYKIRTMRHDAEAATGPVWTQACDPRITLVGKVLRKLHLDELPQLFNVLKGEMALVGPRPERPEFVRVLAEAIPGYRNRLAVLPGVTGLAQVNFPPDTDLRSVQRKLVLDCQYVQSAGPWLDLRLFLCTVARVFQVSLVGVLGLRRTVVIPDSDSDGPSADVAPPVSGHAPHANGNGDGQSLSHVGDGTTHGHRKGPAPVRPR